MRSHQVTSGERVMAQVNGEHRIYTNPWNLKIFSFLTTDVEMSQLKYFSLTLLLYELMLIELRVWPKDFGIFFFEKKLMSRHILSEKKLTSRDISSKKC